MSPRSKLANELRQARIKGCQHYTYFVPLSELDRLITVSVIKKIIQDGDPTMEAAKAREYAEKTEEIAKKLFAILAYQRKGSAICSLLDDGISDQDLPFQAKNVDDKLSLWRRDPQERIQTFERWANDKVEDFDRTQWWMMAPVFDKDSQECLELLDQTILPLIPIEAHEKSDEGIPQLKIGGYSEVSAFRVHPAHNNFWDCAVPLVRIPILPLRSITDNI
jgi:hypothetical protein